MEEKKEEKKFNWLKLLKILLLIVFIFVCFLIYSNKFATHGLKTKEYVIKTSQINDFHGLKIVHISDIHYGKTTFEKDLKQLTKEVNKIKPDLIFFTGDLIDDEIEITSAVTDILTDSLKQMQATYGKYAIKGNHDYNLSEYPIIMDNADFILLDEKFDTIYSPNNETIFIAGMSTNLHGTLNAKDKLNSTIEYLNNLEKKPNYTILLMHEPDYINDVTYNFDLVLAGHSHNGQVRLPIIGAITLPIGAKKYYDEHYKINNTDLYISSGIGTSDVGLRLFNRPSINLYRLIKR